MLTPDQIKEIVKAVFKKASADNDFRKLCLEDPASAIKDLTGKELPADTDIRFTDEKPYLLFTLPPLQTAELSDHELEKVAGGQGDGVDFWSTDGGYCSIAMPGMCGDKPPQGS